MNIDTIAIAAIDNVEPNNKINGTSCLLCLAGGGSIFIFSVSIMLVILGALEKNSSSEYMSSFSWLLFFPLIFSWLTLFSMLFNSKYFKSNITFLIKLFTYKQSPITIIFNPTMYIISPLFKYLGSIIASSFTNVPYLLSKFSIIHFSFSRYILACLFATKGLVYSIVFSVLFPILISLVVSFISNLLNVLS